ncbi:MAG: hypothetical protein ABIR32_04590 [Ilumatobacteraceae bacterium]
MLSVGRTGNFHDDSALRRLELSRYGIPEPLRWNELSLDFVPTRFTAFESAGELELLALVDHQLIHTDRSEASSALLGRVACLAANEPSRSHERAAEIHRERAWGHSRPAPSEFRDISSNSERGPEW